MGARISIQFENNKEKSVVLYSHWGGETFLQNAKKYVKNLILAINANKTQKSSTPYTRLEPNTIMVDFIRYITKDLEKVDGNLYLECNEFQGDNSDYGHHIIQLTNKNETQ